MAAHGRVGGAFLGPTAPAASIPSGLIVARTWPGSGRYAGWGRAAAFRPQARCRVFRLSAARTTVAMPLSSLASTAMASAHWCGATAMTPSQLSGCAARAQASTSAHTDMRTAGLARRVDVENVRTNYFSMTNIPDSSVI